ncbi:hypothetical protein Droror1_Dr00012325 [Drosera rotundifolia]
MLETSLKHRPAVYDEATCSSDPFSLLKVEAGALSESFYRDLDLAIARSLQDDLCHLSISEPLESAPDGGPMLLLMDCGNILGINLDIWWAAAEETLSYDILHLGPLLSFLVWLGGPAVLYLLLQKGAAFFLFGLGRLRNLAVSLSLSLLALELGPWRKACGPASSLKFGDLCTNGPGFAMGRLRYFFLQELVV